MTTAGEAFERARRLTESGQLAEAESIYRNLLRQIPDADELWAALAIVHLQAKKLSDAVDCLRRAITLAPGTAGYHANLGTALRALKRPAEAVTGYREALALGPPTPELHNNLALALKDAGQPREALAEFDAALALRADYANGHFNRANLLHEQARFPEAIASYRRAAELSPRDAAIHCALGVACYDAGQLDDALAASQRALELDPAYPEAHRNRAVIWLSRGDYARGWSEYEWRLECDDVAKRFFEQPRWDGSPLAGRALLVHAEQGLGDSLQFVRYLPAVERAGGTAYFEAPPALAPLLKQSGFERFLFSSVAPPKFDAHCPLVSLAGLIGETNGQPHWPGPYLQADPRLVDAWRPRINGINGLRVGIAWSGNPDHPHDRFRSVHLGQFAPLAAVPGVRLVSLQKGPGREQLATVRGEFEVAELDERMDETAGAFMDTAAVIRNLDLVVTVDTAIAHLAGGLGAPVWVALEHSPDWRWLTSGSETAWYPSMRLFGQREAGDWRAVFEAIAEELSGKVGAG